MAAWAAAVPAATTVLGTVLRSIFDNDYYNVDPSETRGLYGTDPLEEYAKAAAESEARIQGIDNPEIYGALGDQDILRNQQQRYINDLMAQARGDVSYSREQAAQQLGATQAAMQSAAASTGGKFAREGAQRQATNLAAGMPQNIWSSTEALAAQEQSRAQDLLSQILAGRAGQDQATQGVWQSQQGLENKRTTMGMQSGMGHLSTGGIGQRRRISHAVGQQLTNAKAND